MNRHSAHTAQMQALIKAGHPKLAFLLACVRSVPSAILAGSAVKMLSGGVVVLAALKGVWG